MSNAFFLFYGAPVAIASYLVVAWQLRRRLGGPRVDLDNMDVIDANAEDVRFLQATRHGEVMTPVELVEGHAADLGEPGPTGHRAPAQRRVARPRDDPGGRSGADAPRCCWDTSSARSLPTASTATTCTMPPGEFEEAFHAEQAVDEVLAAMAQVRQRAQKIGAFALVPFFGMLIVHAVYNERAAVPGVVRRHSSPRCLASRASRKMRALALREARQEYAEYYFLFPLFLSITLLTSAGFFDVMQSLVAARHRDARPGACRRSRSFWAARFCRRSSTTTSWPILRPAACTASTSAVLHFFAMAQIAGYALGGCWTHIGCAQSVVAYAFIQRDVDEHYTPVQWIREMTPIVVQTFVVLTALIYFEGALLSWR